MQSANASALRFLSHLSVGDLIKYEPEFRLVTVLATDTVSHVLGVLSHHGISSAPVWNARSQQIIGIIDIVSVDPQDIFTPPTAH
jgi:hypothetical protein